MKRNASVIVVGAGISGLTAASVLATRHQVVVVDRLPVAGGTFASCSDDLVQERLQQCRGASVKFLLGAAALRWSSDRKLLVAGPTFGIHWIPGTHVVFAGGIRPSTLAELRIVGDRLAGVLPVTAAYHLLDSGIRLGEHVVVLGAGTWAERIAALLGKQNCRITVLEARESIGFSEPVDELLRGWQATEIHGISRVSEITCAASGQVRRLPCDAVILTAGMRPVRNVDGAIFEEDCRHNVSFAQLSAETLSAEAISRHAESVARPLLEKLGRQAA